MLSYKNLSGNAGIASYEAGDDYIIIEFTDGSTYLYNYNKPGKAHVNHLKSLAVAGRGLTTYINKHVRDNYAGKVG